ncbi:hypothetical protein B7486_55850 [cyanobacterium TDX16]|nr:hypothetical protein B7486_55850 [cyanobacterium TDX16]
MAAGTHCVGCGKVLATASSSSARYRCDGSCRRELDPPRYCGGCGRRMAVQVTPTGWRGRCRDCGTEVSATV